MSDDHSNTAAGAKPIVIGSSILSTLNSTTDVDAFRIYLKANTIYQLVASGPGIDHLNVSTTLDSSNADAWGVTGGGYTEGTKKYFYLQSKYDTWATVSLSNLLGITGSYALTVVDTTVKDFYNIVPGQIVAQNNIPLTGTLDKPGDIDTFHLAVSNGHDYALRLETAHGGLFTLGKSGGNASVRVMNRAGEVVASTIVTKGSADVVLKFRASSTVESDYFTVSVSDPDNVATGNYRLWVSDVTKAAKDDYHGGSLDAVHVGSAITGALETNGDVDTVRVDLSAGYRYYFDAKWTGANSNGAMVSEILDLNGNQLVRLQRGWLDDTFTPTVSGTYIIKTYATSADVGSYSLNLRTLSVPDDVSDAEVSATALSLNQPANGKWHQVADDDVYRILLEQGTTYTLTLTQTGGLAPDGASVGILFGETYQESWYRSIGNSGTLIGSEGKLTMTFTPEKTHYYYLHAYSHSTDASYQLLVTAAPDTSAPSVPSVGIELGVDGLIASNKPRFVGQADPGSTTEVYVNGILWGSAAANKLGYWELASSPALPEGSFAITARSRDSANNVSALSAPYSASLAPAKPNAPTVTGEVKDGSYVTSATFSLRGKGDPGNLIAVLADGQKIGAAKVDAQGGWEATGLSLKDGEHKLQVISTAANGQASQTALAVLVDTLAPHLDIVDFAGADGFLQTNIASLSGQTEPFAAVKLTSAGISLAEFRADSAGRWSWQSSPLAQGQHDWLVFARDLTGNESKASSISFVVDTLAPAAPVIGNVSLAASGPDSNRPVVAGTSEPFATITLMEKGKEIHTVKANATGQWSTQLAAMDNGVKEFSAVAVDSAGNRSVASAKSVLTLASQLNFAGTSGNDIFKLAPGSHFVDGGAGRDQLQFDRPSSQYTLKSNDDGSILVSDGCDNQVLKNIERIVFSDKATALDTGAGQHGGMVYRLYQAAFDRTPDAKGLGYWLGQLDNGVAFKDIANAFVSSLEFAALVGGKDVHNGSFVRKIYTNVLGRDPDLAGYDYWIQALDNGLSRPEMLTMFSEGDENVSLVGISISKGFDYIPA